MAWEEEGAPQRPGGQVSGLRRTGHRAGGHGHHLGDSSHTGDTSCLSPRTQCRLTMLSGCCTGHQGPLQELRVTLFNVCPLYACSLLCVRVSHGSVSAMPLFPKSLTLLSVLSFVSQPHHTAPGLPGTDPTCASQGDTSCQLPSRDRALDFWTSDINVRAA